MGAKLGQLLGLQLLNCEQKLSIRESYRFDICFLNSRGVWWVIRLKNFVKVDASAKPKLKAISCI